MERNKDAAVEVGAEAAEEAAAVEAGAQPAAVGGDCQGAAAWATRAVEEGLLVAAGAVAAVVVT